jgi:hypothetical protein
MNLKIKIKLEKKRLFIRRKRERRRAWCETCAAETDFVSAQEIGQMASRLDKNFENEKLHKFSAPDGTTLICLASALESEGNLK